MAEENHWDTYKPSAALAIVVAIIFLVMGVLHLIRIIRGRRWFGLAIVVGCIFEVVGFAARAISSHKPTSMGPYIIQALLILLAPILFAATIYMFLGRLIAASGYPNFSPIRLKWLTKIFVTGDIACFVVQALGGAVLASAKDASALNRGKEIILLGLALQVVIFAIFVLASIVFHKRMVSKRAMEMVDASLRLRPMLGSLYLTSSLILVRNIFRFVEYATGKTGYLQTHEWPTYVFDALLMVALTVATWFWYFANTDPREPVERSVPLEDMEAATADSDGKVETPRY